MIPQLPNIGFKELEPRGKIFWMLCHLQKVYCDSLNLYIWIPDCETHKKMKGTWSKIHFYILTLKLKCIHPTMNIDKPHYPNVRMWLNSSIARMSNSIALRDVSQRITIFFVFAEPGCPWPARDAPYVYTPAHHVNGVISAISFYFK